MAVDKKLRRQIFDAIQEIGEGRATIKQIEKKVPLERHALSKYLHILMKDGYLEYAAIGKAKVWFINRAPWKVVFDEDKENSTFSEAILRSVLTKIPLGLTMIDEKYEILFTNNYMERLYPESSGKKFFEQVLGRKNMNGLKSLKKIGSGKVDSTKFTTKDKYGNKLWITASRIKNPAIGTCTVLMIENVTKQVELRRRLRRMQSCFHSIMDNITMGIILTDNDHNINHINPAAVKKLGYVSELQIKNMKMTKLVSNGDFDKIDKKNPSVTFVLSSKGKKYEANVSLIEPSKNSIKGYIYTF